MCYFTHGKLSFDNQNFTLVPALLYLIRPSECYFSASNAQISAVNPLCPVCRLV